MFRTNGIVNPDIEHAETVSRLLDVPRANVDDASEVFDSLNADAHTLALMVREWSPLATIREVSAHEVVVIAQPPPTEMHPAERDAALARYVTDARARLRHSNPDFQPPVRTGVGSEDAALLRDTLGVYLRARDSSVRPAVVTVEPLARVVQEGATASAHRREEQGGAAALPRREPEDPIPPLSKEFAAEHLFKCKTVDELNGIMERGDIRWSPTKSRQGFVFDRGDVQTWNAPALARLDEIIEKFREQQRKARRKAAATRKSRR